jgi:hypothetical protein
MHSSQKTTARQEPARTGCSHPLQSRDGQVGVSMTRAIKSEQSTFLVIQNNYLQ